MLEFSHLMGAEGEQLKPIALIIEGDFDIKEFYEITLVYFSAPFRLVVEDSPVKGLDYYKEKKDEVDLIVLGKELTGKPADDVAEEIRQISGRADYPYILRLIGGEYLSSENSRFMRERGVNEIIYEPLLPPITFIQKLNEIYRKLRIPKSE